MLDYNIEKAAEKFVCELKESDVYKQYQIQLEKIKRYPEHHQRINEFRERNYELQNAEQTDDFFDKLDVFEKEYEKFREDPLVDDFLRAELAFCRMVQNVMMYITEELDFE